MIKTCLACGETMSEDDDSVAYFSFPSDNQMLEKWLDFCNLTKKLIRYYNHYFICSKHFKTEDLIDRRMDGGFIKLHYHAVPSLFPPTDIKHNLNQIRSIRSVKPNMFLLLDSDEETESPDSPIPEQNPNSNGDNNEEQILNEATQKRAEKCWELAKETLRQQKRKITELQRQNRRLSRQVNNLKNKISELDGAHLIDERAVFLLCERTRTADWEVVLRLCYCNSTAINFFDQMPHVCGVVNCSSNSFKHVKSFFRIPSPRNKRGEIEEVRLLRRIAWIQALNRTDLTINKIKNMRICSDHFISGKPAPDECPDHPDYVPSLKMTGGTKQRSTKKKKTVEVAIKNEYYEEVNDNKICVFVKENNRDLLPEIFDCQIRDLEMLRCKNCNFKTHLLIQLNEHIKMIHKPISVTNFRKIDPLITIKCEYCDFQTYSQLVYLKHRDQCCQSGEINRFKCDHCFYKTKRLFSLKNHIVTNHTQPELIRWFRCEYCAYQAKVKGYLKRHIQRMHLGAKIDGFSCKQCFYTSKTKSGLTRHVLLVHPKS